MSKIHYLHKVPEIKSYYLVDACFLINRYIPLDKILVVEEKNMVALSQEWWKVIEQQLHSGQAMVYVLNISIAEAFKAMTKQYFLNRISYNTYVKATKALRKDLVLSPKEAKKQNRRILFHDIELNRDIIIGVDRFFEIFLKNYKKVSTSDLLILSTAKYLVDFYNYSDSNLFVVTTDNDLWRGSKRIGDIPYVYNPNHKSNYASKIFR